MSVYYSWINNTNKGATAAQTEVNLRFFKWLHDEYGMSLEVYRFDAGAVDGAGGYGHTDSERFKRQFPDGFAPLAKLAASFGCRLGLWCGPDGFGDTAEEEARRHEMMVSLCRDHRFRLFKFDGVCGQLRPTKEEAFVRMMTECRKHVPDLIVLNHRLKLGKGMPHATTFLWEGRETYIDVHIADADCATHNRACTPLRGNTPGLIRLAEDCGVCLSSCLDYWEDDLVFRLYLGGVWRGYPVEGPAFSTVLAGQGHPRWRSEVLTRLHQWAWPIMSDSSLSRVIKQCICPLFLLGLHPRAVIIE